MAKIRILLVDDDRDILFLLAHSIKRLGPDYDVTTAMDGETALAAAEQQPFDLVLTDHMMPHMTGLDLAQAINQRWPETPILLMTAYEAHRISDIANVGYVTEVIRKPFKLPSVLNLIKSLTADAGTGSRTAAGQPAIPVKATRHLQTLWDEANANLVLLLNGAGDAVRVVGDTDPNTVARLATFVAENFLAVAELASLLGDNNATFRSSYHEGNIYNIYSVDVNRNYFLAVVFDAGKKPGPIWIYTRQTAKTLAALLPKTL